ncbi:PREDICTED: protein ALP1-like [Branchiostoma belcheri]|uniref:Protein ALP1-like n=1 Tax=Branchiostoma belcheri TaxID=7741 RepID=A0A6P4ZAS3_BRABE|nr:PREDICTED: protein ALP1-like [Branchiostoma belcheri]
MAGEQALFLFFMRQMFFFFVMRMYMRRRALGRRRIGRRRDRYHEIQRAAVFAAIAIAQAGQVDRAVRDRDETRTTAWWDTVVFHPAFDDKEWYRRFRMTRATFLRICDELEPRLVRTTTRLRTPIPVRKRVAVAIYWLASGDLFRTVADLFGLSTASVCNLVHDFCQVVVETLLPRYISWPKGEALRQTVNGYEQRWAFPQCAGAVDGTHIEVKAPSEGHTDYFNRKGYHSVVLQAVVDFCYRFTDINVGWPGCVHDARILRNSLPYRCAERGTLFPPEMTRVINGVPVPVMILGDPAYPLLPWLMKGYADNGHLSRRKTNFNFRLSSARMTVECAFGRLKGRWRCLAKSLDVDISKVPNIVSACCVLHNILEMNREEFDQAWFMPDEEVPQAPVVHGEARTHAVRDALADLFAAEDL